MVGEVKRKQRKPAERAWFLGCQPSLYSGRFQTAVEAQKKSKNLFWGLQESGFVGHEERRLHEDLQDQRKVAVLV